MSEALTNMMLSSGNRLYYSDKFRVVLEDHLSILKSYANTMVVSEQLEHKNQGYFHGLLRDLKIPQELHWVITRINGFKGQTDYNSILGIIYIPDQSVLNQILQQYSSINT